MNSKKKNTLTLLLIVVIVVIVGLIGYLGFEVINGNIKESKSQEITDEFDDLIPTITEEEFTDTTNETATGDSESSTGSSATSSSSGGSTGTYSGGVTISGYTVLGTIRIPATGIKYSIFAEPSKTALERGIGLVYTTSGLNQVGNTVLAGHNYRNRLFFSRNKNLKSGDEIIIKDTTGVEVTYAVYSTFVTTSTDTSFYQNYEAGKREVTLTTCTDNGTKTGERLIVRAREK